MCGLDAPPGRPDRATPAHPGSHGTSPTSSHHPSASGPRSRCRAGLRVLLDPHQRLAEPPPPRRAARTPAPTRAFIPRATRSTA